MEILALTSAGAIGRSQSGQQSRHQRDEGDDDDQFDQGLRVAGRRALTLSAGTEQFARWRSFDGERLLEVERAETRLVVHYAKTDDSARRLRDLVAAERGC